MLSTDRLAFKNLDFFIVPRHLYVEVVLYRRNPLVFFNFKPVNVRMRQPAVSTTHVNALIGRRMV